MITEETDPIKILALEHKLDMYKKKEAQIEKEKEAFKQSEKERGVRYKEDFPSSTDYYLTTAKQYLHPKGLAYAGTNLLKGAIEGTEWMGGQFGKSFLGLGETPDPSKGILENVLYHPVAGEKLGLNKLINYLEPDRPTKGMLDIGDVANVAGTFIGPGEISSMAKAGKKGIESLGTKVMGEEIAPLMDPAKRDTLKVGAGIGAGAALYPIAKKINMLEDLGKAVPKKAPFLKVMRPLGKTETEFPEWFPSLINRVRTEGEMKPIYRTEKIPITNEEFMEKIKKGEAKDVYANPRTEEYFKKNPSEHPYYKIKQTEDIIGYEYVDKNLPGVKVKEYDGKEANVYFENHYGQPVEINYKKPSFNKDGEFSVRDSVPESGSGYDSAPDFEENYVSHLDEVLGGTSNLEKYATKSKKSRYTKGEAAVDEANARAEMEYDRMKDEGLFDE